MRDTLFLARLRAPFTYGVLLAAVVLVVLLSRQTRVLRAALRSAEREAILPATGQVVPPFRAVTLDGDSIALGEGADGSRQVLFVFNTTCGFCLRTLPAWKRIAQRLDTQPDVAIIGWSHHSDSLTRAYVAANQLDFATIVGVAEKYATLYHASAVPATMVIDAAGLVLYARPGVLTSAAEDSVLSAARGAP